MGNKSRDKWRSIPSLPHYEISENGKIRRVTAARTRKVGHIVKGGDNGQGYRRVKLAIGNGRKKTFRVHQLVVEAFLGPCPPDKSQIAHFNGVRNSNHYSNLRWATHKENMADRTRHGSLAGERNGRAKLTYQLVQKIRSEYSGRHGHAIKLARKYNVGSTAIYDILQKRSWTRGK